MSLSALPHHKPATDSGPLSSSSAHVLNSPSYLILSLLLAIFGLAPLFYPGYIQTHAGFVPLWNIADLRANLGQWDWTPHLATQFDPWRSDGLLPYYLAAILPFEPVTAIKAVLGLSWLLGNAGLFLWLRRWLGQPGAVVAALVYTYLPYQIATVYVRGAWGETLVWGLLPWAMILSESASQRVSESNSRVRWVYFCVAGLVWLGLGMSCLGLSGWTFIFVALLLWFIHKRQALWPILANFLGIILATIILLSGFASSPPASFPSVSFADHFLYPFQLFSAYWGFGPSRPGWNDGLSFQLGFTAIGLTVLTLFLWRRRSSGSPSGLIPRYLIFCGSAALVLILLQFGLTEFLWQLPLFPDYTLASSLTYPWQLLGLIGLCLAVLAGTSLALDEQLTRLPVFGATILMIILSSYAYLAPQFIRVESFMLTGPQAVWEANQLVLLSHEFSVEISGNSAGLEREPTTIPLTSHGPLRANETLRLEVIWQPLRAFGEDWKIFVHLLGSNGQVLAQFDGPPREGTYPTSRWIPGELIPDSYPLRLPAETQSGPYQVYIGLYNEATGARLPVTGDTEARVVLNVE